MTLDMMRKQLATDIGADVYAEFDTKHADCLCIVILKDVGPEKTGTAIRAVLKSGVSRVCANVVEEILAKRVRDAFTLGGFEAAWDESWKVNVATVRT